MRSKIIGFIILTIEKMTSYRFLRKYYSNVFTEKPVIIDVGTNRGQFIDLVLRINNKSQIYGFEPNLKFKKTLISKYKNNSKVEIVYKGISSEKGMKKFNYNFFDETSSFEDLNMNSVYLKKKSKILGVNPEDIIIKSELIEIITLGDFISNLDHKIIDLIKIDTEGHEYECLVGLFNSIKYKEIKRIQIEHHEIDMYKDFTGFDKINKLMNNNSFYEEARYKHKFGNFWEIIYKLC